MLRGGNLRAITRKIIEVEPYPWLEKIVKSSKKLSPELAKGQNAILQGQNSQKRALYSVWSGRQDLNLRPRRPKRRALPTVLRPVVIPAGVVIRPVAKQPRRESKRRPPSKDPSRVMVIPAGVEPAIFWMRTRRPRPLDDGTITLL